MSSEFSTEEMMIVHGLDTISFVDRVNYIQSLCKGKRILHLGATDSPRTKEAAEEGSLLHLHIKEVAEYLVGLDLDQEMIEFLSSQYGIDNIQYGNIENLDHYPAEKFDVIIAGEIFEHLSNPGKALTCLHSIMDSSTKLVITVPNAYSVKGFLRALAKYELIHSQHVLHHSPHTLIALLQRHGFTSISCFSYVNGGQGVLASVANSLIRIYPQVAEGIGMICQLE